MKKYIYPVYKFEKISSKDIITMSYQSTTSEENVTIGGQEQNVKTETIDFNVGKLL